MYEEKIWFNALNLEEFMLSLVDLKPIWKLFDFLLSALNLIHKPYSGSKTRFTYAVRYVASRFNC